MCARSPIRSARLASAPILVGKDNSVLDGAVHLQAARLLGLGRAQCIRIEYLSEKKQRVLRLAVKHLSETGEWDLDELKIEFEGALSRQRQRVAVCRVRWRITISFARHQFPPAIIRYAVWLYLRFKLCYRDVEDLLAERGLDVSYETVRRWVLRFGPLFARQLHRRRPRPKSQWHLDEMAVMLAGRQYEGRR